MKKAITFNLILITILMPLLIIPDKDNYNILKFGTLLILGFILLVLLFASYKALYLDKKDIIILIFIGLVFISTLSAINIKVAIFGEENRYEGLLTFVVYAIIYVCSKKFFTMKKISAFLNILFWTTMVIGTLGIAQKYVNCDILFPIFNKGICATFGNSNFFGSFISIALPISICIFIFYGSKKGLILSTILFYNMISSGTRSTWVAFIMIAVIGTIYLIKEKNKKFFLRAMLLLILFIFIFVYLINGFQYIFNKLRINKNSDNENTVISSQKTVTELKVQMIKDELTQSKKTGAANGLGSGRIEIWNMTIKLMCVRPVFGCGPDNILCGLAKYCTKELNAFAIRTGTIPDKAHNEYLQIGATIGIPALICYLIFILLIIINNAKSMFNNKIYFAIGLSIIGYLIQAFFNISTIGVAPIFWMMLGLIDNRKFMIDLNNLILEKR